MTSYKKRTARVFYNGLLAGILTKSETGYQFEYDAFYLKTAGSRPISITLPMSKEVHKSEFLFPAFVNLLSEGSNKRMQCRMLKIDENDYFSLLLATASDDSIGPITIKEINEPA